MVASTLICPNCGSNLLFDIEKQSFCCGSCDSQFAEKELHEAREAYGDEFEKYSCPSCGASVVTERGNAASFCAFCGNHIVVTAKVHAGDCPPKKIIPFKKTRLEAEETYRKMCKGYPFLPSAFKGEGHLQELQSIYVPFWLYSAGRNGEMLAECEIIEQWSDSSYDYVKTDTYEVLRAGEIGFQNIPYDASEMMDDQKIHTIEAFEFDAAVPYSPSYLSGHSIAIPDSPMDKMDRDFELRTNKELEAELKNSMRNYSRISVKSSKTHANRLTKEYAVFPIWLHTCEYHKKQYTFLMNGQTGQYIGNLPMDKKKIGISFGVIFAAVSTVTFLIQEALLWWY